MGLMKAIRTVVLVVFFVVVAIPAVALVVLWIEGSSSITEAEHNGLLRVGPKDNTLTVAERTIAIAEFSSTWNVRRAVCRPVASLWTAATQPDVRASDSSVSMALSTAILREEEPATSLRWRFKRVFAACQLEQRYSDTQMLRAWLSNAYFGVRPFGIESAAQTLLGKDAGDLDASDSARLAALLRAPRLREDSERWNDRARLIGERVAASALPR